jgi:thiol-disulfide isomerase/thioredoxin
MKRIVFLVVAFLALGAGCPSDAQMDRVKDAAMDVEQDRVYSAPDITLENYEGVLMSPFDIFEETPLVINTWASWCPFCKKELVDFAAVQKEFEGKVVFIAINRAEPLSIAKQYSDELGVTDDMIFLLDPSDSFYKSIGGFSMPETIFVDWEGNVVFHKRGPMSQEEIRDRVEDLIVIN